MKTLTRYIYESYKNIRLNEVTVKFGIDSKDLYIEVPDNYLEDEIQTYLDDTIINKTFVGPDYSKDILGRNEDNIADAYFEYSGIIESHQKPNIEYDSHYDKNADISKLKIMKLTDFKFVIVFDRFDIKLNDDDEVKQILNQIFEMCISDDHKWPLNFTYTDDDLEYNKQ